MSSSSSSPIAYTGHPSNRKRIIIIGGGPSGISAADKLSFASSTSQYYDIQILEANPSRLGGRTCSEPLKTYPDSTVDLGGQWIGSKQEAILQVVKELQLTLHPQYCTGKRILDLQNIITTYKGLIPNASITVLLDAQCMLLSISILQFILSCFRLTRLRHWLDNMTVETLVNRLMWTVGGKALVAIVVQALFGLEPADISALAFCRYASASGTLEEMTEIGPGSLQCWTVVGGMGQVTNGLYQRMKNNGNVQVFFNHIVTQVRYRNTTTKDVQIICDNGTEFIADYVILAIPPPIAKFITFEPSLDHHRVTLMHQSTMGGIIKAVIVYNEPFWRHQGFSGEVICDTSDNGNGPVFNVFDGVMPKTKHSLSMVKERKGAAKDISVTVGCPIYDSQTMIPALIVFINGQRAREWSTRPVNERQQAVLHQLARWFGNKALEPIEYVEKDWLSDPFTRGCPIASYGRQLLTDYGVYNELRKPAYPDNRYGTVIHHLHFAGTETATNSTGFVDGAIRAGWVAAESILNDTAIERMNGTNSSSTGIPSVVNSGTITTPSPIKQIDIKSSNNGSIVGTSASVIQDTRYGNDTKEVSLLV